MYRILDSIKIAISDHRTQPTKNGNEQMIEFFLPGWEGEKVFVKHDDKWLYFTPFVKEGFQKRHVVQDNSRVTHGARSILKLVGRHYAPLEHFKGVFRAPLGGK